MESVHTKTPAAAPSRPWCLFRSRHMALAVGLEAVAEVVEIDRMVRLPQSPPRVVGLCALRRDVIPVVSLDETAAEPPARVQALILRTSQGAWGIWIDHEGTVVTEGPLEPTGADAGSGETAVVVGTVHHDGATHAVIDPEATWRRLRGGVEEWYANLVSQAPARDAATAAAGHQRSVRDTGVSA